MKQKKYLGRRIFALTLALLLSLNTATAYAAPDVPAVSESAENVSVSAEPSGNQEEPKAAEETGDTGNNTEAEEESKENGSEDIAAEGKDPNGQNTAGAPAGGTEVTDPAAGGDGSVVSGADTPSEDELPEEETEVEAEPETEPEAVPGEMPEEVKAFLDAAAALPSADEVTAENAEEVGEQVNAAFDLYDVLVDLGYGEREDVAEAIEKINAVFEAVLAAENIEPGDVYNEERLPYVSSSGVTKSAFENAVNLDQSDTCYGIVKLNGEAEYDSGTPNVWPTGGWDGSVNVTGYNWVHITNTNPSVATASYEIDGGKLTITFTPGESSGTTKISVGVDAKYPHYSLGTWNMNLNFDYTVTNGSSSVAGTQLGTVMRSVTYDLATDKAVWGKNPYNGQYGERSSIGVGIINDVKVTNYAGTRYYSFYAWEMLDISVGSYDTSIATVEAYEINSSASADDVNNTTKKGVGIKVTGLKAGETKVVVTPKFKIPTTDDGVNAYFVTRTMPITVYIKVTGEKSNTEYELTYDANGGAFGTGDQTITQKQSNPEFTVISAEPSRDGYIFKGWADSADATDKTYEADDKITLTKENSSKTIYAVWEKNDPIPTPTYTVWYKDGVLGEIVFPDQGYEGLEEGDNTPEFKSGNPERDGYTFTGWTPAVNPVVSADDADKNGEIIYTATWKKNGVPLEDLTVTKTPSEKYPVVGKDFIYTIKVENKNSEAVSVKITDKLNEKLDFVSASDGSKYDEKDRTVTWENISVPANGYKEVTLTVKANAAGTIYNEAEAEWESGSASGNTTVAAKEPDPDPANIVYVAGEGGTQDGKDKSVKAGPADISAKAAADDGYYFVNWTAAAEGDDDFEFAPSDKEQLTGTINAVSGATYTFTANFAPKKVLNIEITGKTKTVVYNGKEQSVTGYDMVVKDENGKEISLPRGLTVIPASDNCEAKGTNARDEAYPMELKAGDFELTGDGAEKYTVTFTVTDGWLKIVEKKKLAVTAGDVDTVYDGKEHPVTPVVTVGETVKTDDAEITIVYVDKDGNESEKAPVDAGTYTAKVTAKLDGYEDATCEATVTIAKRKLTVTTGSASKTYDGTPLTNSTAAVAVEGGAVDGEEITATATGSRTEVGSAVNTYRLNWGNAKEGNYEIAGETLGTLTVNTAGGGGGGNNDDDDDDDDPDPTPTPTPPAPTPTPIIPGPVPTVGPVPVVPTVTPVAPTTTAPTPTAALVSPTPEAVALADEAVPLAAEDEKQPEPVEINEEGTPLAGGKGASWALINFALMNLAIFESLMLLIGYFVNTKNDKEDEEEKRKLKKKGIFRIISIPIAIISLIAFILTEDITLPTAFVDKYTIVMLIIAIVQTVVVALSNKKYEDEEEA